jgi:hypothetical protein
MKARERREEEIKKKKKKIVRRENLIFEKKKYLVLKFSFDLDLIIGFSNSRIMFLNLNFCPSLELLKVSLSLYRQN